MLHMAAACDSRVTVVCDFLHGQQGNAHCRLLHAYSSQPTGHCQPTTMQAALAAACISSAAACWRVLSSRVLQVHGSGAQTNCRLVQEWPTSLQIDRVLQAQSYDLGSCLIQHARREIDPSYVLHLQGKAHQQLTPARLLARARVPPAVCCNVCMPQRSST